MDVAIKASEAYYASILVHLPIIANEDAVQNLGLSPTLFNRDGSSQNTNQYGLFSHPFTQKHQTRTTKRWR